MAENTPVSLRQQVIYSVFVRNHTPEGTFAALLPDLPRIRDLGTDIVWLMPIHPLGVEKRKGTLGSPYAIRDYRAVNPEYGTLADFRRLVDAIHALGMKCIIDVVYNHTSPDSVLAGEHPEWFYRRPDGSFGNRVGDWSDIIDLDYSSCALWDYQIDTLCYWATMVDGFRCDVAPLVPLAFWKLARARVEQVRPGAIWLAESVEHSFIAHMRGRGIPCLSDSQLYEAFDLCYDYDVYPLLQDCLRGELPLERYVQALNLQETTYPENYGKLRFLENHDRPRAAFLFPDARVLRNWTAFFFFQKGPALLYAGQERSCTHLPSLFDLDPVSWSGGDLTPLIKTLCSLKKHPLMATGSYRAEVLLPGRAVRAAFRRGAHCLVGFFALDGAEHLLPAGVPDGVYHELLGEDKVEVLHGLVSCPGRPLIFETVLSETELTV